MGAAVVVDGYRFTPLHEVDLPALAAAIDCETVQARLTHYTVSTLLEQLRCYAADGERGVVLMLAIEDLANGSYVGVCGLIDRGVELRTATYLHHRVHGAGVNRRCKQLQYEASLVLGRQLFVSVQDNNPRSQAAVRRAWPNIEPRLLQENPTRRAYIWSITEPPSFGRVGEAERTDVGEFIAASPLANKSA
jgi:hypothetical protein